MQKIIKFTRRPESLPDLNVTGRGAEQWHGAAVVGIPSDTNRYSPLDVYYRFPATRICRPDGTYDYTYFDNLVNAAIQKRQRFHFGIMTAYPEGDTSVGMARFTEGGYGAYPESLHKKMQADVRKDWRLGDTWTPNYNSPHYLAWYLDMNLKLDAHIKSTVVNGIRYRDVVGIIDIRGYGSWGEWNSSNLVNHTDEYPPGTFPTIDSFKKIVDAHTKGFPDNPLVAMIAGYDAHWLGIVNNPPEIAHYLLTQRNNWGLIGWRRDQWGATDSYLRSYLEENNRGWGDIPYFKVPIMSRYKESPITGEPAPFSNDMAILEANVRLYHATSFGNGNYGNAPNETVKDRVRAASKASGFRIIVTQADVNVDGKKVTIKMSWQNEGICPPYWDWTPVFELVDSAGKIIPLGESLFNLKRFQVAGVPSVKVDEFTANVPDGKYKIQFAVRDLSPSRYMRNMPLYVEEGNADAYPLGEFDFTGAMPPPPPPANKPPVVSAGPDLVLQLPNNIATLRGTATDPDGTITKVLWEQLSGPATTVISTPSRLQTSVRFNVHGVYRFRLTAHDDKGATTVDEQDTEVKPVVIPEPTPQKKIVQADVLYDNGTKETLFPKV